MPPNRRRLAEFLHQEAASGIVVLLATVVALVWANSPWSQSYQELWGTKLTLGIADASITETLGHWVNDALMALFFFVVGIEIKYELVAGQLSKARDAALPMIAAIGGMVVPASIYVALNAGGPGAHGWGIPMATDIAFAVGVFALLGSRALAPLKVLLLAIAVVDDLGAVVVIAAFYSSDVDLRWLAVAVVGLGVALAATRARAWSLVLFAPAAVFVWVATFSSGIHATMAGVALGLVVPVTARRRPGPAVGADGAARTWAWRLRAPISGGAIERRLHPWTTFLVVPLFALANAGVDLAGEVVGDSVTSRVTIGIVAGLFVGKLVGISGAIALATRAGLAELPHGVRFRHVVGMALIAGVGFTMSIFIAGLAFDDPALVEQAKIGVLVGSGVSAVAGVVVLRRASPR